MEMKKRLCKSRDDKALFGVCGGIAEYFDVDSLIVRLIFVLFTIMYGAGVMIYLVAALIMPNETVVPSDSGDSPYIDADGTVYQNRAAMSEEQESSGATTEFPETQKSAVKHVNSSAKTFGFILIAFGIFMLLRVFLPQIDVRIMIAGGCIAAGFLFIIKKV
jgi:phage shock protein PspC (stress-responsive transcriptional regulator)